MTRSINRLASACAGAARQPGLFASQRGASILPLALAVFLGTSAIAAPLLNRAVTAMTSTERASTTETVGAEAAAWYAMWRLEHDPSIHTEFTGSPPTATFEFRGAQVTIIGVEPPDNHGITMSLTSTPNEALPNTPATVTYTLTVKNDDDQSHDIIYVEADPAGSFSPTYVPGSTSGLTTVEPSTGNKFIWTFDPVTLGPFGAEATMTWQMTVDEDEGNYWMEGEVRIHGIGSIEGLTEANVLVAPPNDIVVTTTVDPVQVEAGDPEVYNYTVLIQNNGTDDVTLNTIKHWASKAFDHVPNSTSGVTVANPNRNSDFRSNERWEWTWDGLNEVLPAGGYLTLTFEMDATLTPGTWFSETATITAESQAGGQDVAATTSATAPIKAVRVYDIHVDHNDVSLDIEALLDNTGVEALTWVQS